ncbi:MAG: DinB family protein [Ardenticatenaceae bacterium]|nr:DinB family protein [Anaerolineales bacterium]MCB8982075.1 DinB family protein [Ardenticatenaceae bacterium]
MLVREYTMSLDQYFRHWQPIRTNLLATIDKFSDRELAYVPFPGSRSVGQIIRHIANTEDGWFRYVVMQEAREWPPEFTAAAYPTVAATKVLLNRIHDHTMIYLSDWDCADLERPIATPWGDTFTLGWIIWHVMEHEIHHRGELSLILGLMGREGLNV